MFVVIFLPITKKVKIMDTVLPNKRQAALLDDVNYSVPGLFQFSSLICDYIDLVKAKFDYKIPIKYVYGAPQVRWNGGRLIVKKNRNSLSMYNIENEMTNLIGKGIIPLLTFSNCLITENELKDLYCNEILDIANEVGSELIVNNDLLYSYIKTKYPNIKIHCSVIKTAFKENRNSEFYDELSKKYDIFVIHPDDNFNIDLLKKIPKENAEIMLNERCIYKCCNRARHYLAISEEQKSQSNGYFVNTHFLDGCAAIPEFKQSLWKSRNISLTTEEVIQINKLGFKNFKIQGRTDSLYLLFFDILRYTLENQMAFPTCYSIMTHYIERYREK